MKIAAPVVEPIPQLAPPGARLPWLELRIARLGFRWLSRDATREKSAALLAKEQAAILALAESCDAEAGSRRVLIRRIPGMEDSSRYWSVFMTLEHLRLVNTGVADIIHALGKGNLPSRPANTANVKPAPGADVTALRHFKASCGLIERAVSRIDNLRTIRFAHPWFGLLDAGLWYFLTGFHARLHRQQIEAILRQR
jgi:hypothetical protein